MKVIKGVLKEELNNSLAMRMNYQRELAKLPKGSLVKKKIKGNEYYYLVLREKGKVKFIYKGKLNADEVKRYKQAREYRAKYRKLVSELNKQIKFLKGTLRGKKIATKALRHKEKRLSVAVARLVSSVVLRSA